jgi:hypothetical protein
MEYVEAKDKYEKYYEAKMGVKPREPTKPQNFNVGRIRAVCTSERVIPATETRLYRALGRVLVNFIKRLVGGNVGGS